MHICNDIRERERKFLKRMKEKRIFFNFFKYRIKSATILYLKLEKYLYVTFICHNFNFNSKIRIKMLA